MLDVSLDKLFRLLTAGIFFASCHLSGCSDDAASDTDPELSLEEKITAIGNAGTDKLRYEGLVELEPDVEQDSLLFAEWEELTLFIDKWTNGRDKYWQPGDQEMAAEGGYLADFFVENAWPGDNEFPADVRKASPLYPLWCFYRGRMLIWYAVEMGFLTEVYFEEGVELLEKARVAFPDNPVLPMYLGELVDWALPLDTPNNAPAWAQHQRELLAKLVSIIDYWVTERQAVDGQFGGGWGDDVEVWRRWTPVLLAFQNEAAFKEEVRFTDRVYKFHAAFANAYLEEPVPNLNADLLYSMLTGDFGDASYLPLNALRWQTEPTDFAALVESHSPSHLNAQVYHFGTSAREMGVEMFILDPAQYVWRLECDNQTQMSGAFDSTETSTFSFSLPSKKVCYLGVEQAP
ncbi:MAG: hypothetical protein HOI23_00375 [Deltaproteobacteria bacterium]|jgi:hypothetical protein|nr:hypothetical protein [Deltaproteobacteria bacterium]MBT6434849.1 hypothetical protein [Deltaproteobacteria bacterium]MBT6492735.1 hypothetical protein [Deltaproteobacteria bacterium]